MPLASPEARNLVEDVLERIRKKYKFFVAGYVVMPEHVHMLVNEPGQSTLDQAIKAFKHSVTFRDSIPLERLPLNQCLLQFWNTSP
jgi:putative transposase